MADPGAITDAGDSAGRIIDAALGIPHPRLRPLVNRYAGYRYLGFPPGVHRGLPSRSLTVVIALGAPTRMTTMPRPDQQPAEFRALASGLHPGAVGIGHDGDQYGVQLDLTPLGARLLLGVPAGELAGLVIDLCDLLGPDTDELLSRMATAVGWIERFNVLDEVLLRGTVRGDEQLPDIPLQQAWELLLRSGGLVRIDTLASSVGWSRRHLSARFQQEYGLTPKELGRIVRFERSVRLLRSGRRRNLADVAAVCGYYDQAHLSREWNALAGCPPSVWLASEELPSVQDASAEAEEPAVP